MLVGATALSAFGALRGLCWNPTRVARIGGYVHGGYSLLLVLPALGTGHAGVAAVLGVAVVACFAGASGYRRSEAYLVAAFATAASIGLLAYQQGGVDVSFVFLAMLLPSMLLAGIARVRRRPGPGRLASRGGRVSLPAQGG